MKKIILCFSIVGALTAHAQTVTWGTPTTVAGNSDVLTNGTYFGSWAPDDGSSTSDPVNGVTFHGFSDLPSFSQNFGGNYNGFSSPPNTSGNYATLLRFGNYNGTSGYFQWGGMVPGGLYEVQFWVNDSRSGTSQQTEILNGGAAGAAVAGTDSSGPLAFGGGATGTNAQYITGTFTADGAGSEQILVSGGSGGFVYGNLVQVRTLLAVATPTASPALVYAGESVTLSAVVGGDAPSSYQWLANGTAISGATSSTYQFTASNAGNSPVTTNYSLTVVNDQGTFTSAALALTINPPTAASAVPNGAATTFFLGDSPTFSYALSGNPPISVEWLHNGTPIGTFTNIGSAATTSLTLNNLQSSQSGSYTVIVSNSLTVGNGTPSTAYTVQPYLQFAWFQPQPITTADAALELFGGATNPAVVFEASAFGTLASSAVVSLDDGQNITFDELNVVASCNGVGPFNGNFGTYTGTTSNAVFDSVLNGSALGINANVSSITFNSLTPGNLYGLQIFATDDRAGNGATHSINFSDSNDTNNTSPSYLEGANNYTLGAFVANQTNQSVKMLLPNPGGNVLEAAVIYSLPLGATAWDALTVSPSTTVFAGTAMTISDALVTGLPPLSYQWQSNGVNIAGATNSVLTFTATNASQSVPVVVNYDLVVANASGTNTTPAVAVTINPASPPVAAINAAPPTLFLGDNVTLSFAVNGTPPLWVEFEHNGSPIGTFTNIGGAASTSLTLTALQASQGGTYSIIVTNQFGTLNSATNGQDYSLTVNPYTQFTWFAPQPITTADATLELFGGATNPAVVFEATDFGTSVLQVTLGDGQVITFNAEGTVDNANGQIFGGGPFGTYTGTTGNAVFDAVLQDSSPMIFTTSITFSNMIPGNLYGLQVFVTDDRASQGAGDLVEFQDPNDTNNISLSYLEGANDYALGMFVANGTNQTVNMRLPGLTTGGGVLDAAVIYSLPLGAMAWDTPTVSPSTTVFAGTLLTISNALVTGIAPFTYQWQANGVNITGATNSILTITATNTSQSTPVVVNYDLVVANASGTNTSPAVAVTINPASPPVVATNETLPATIFSGDTVTLSFAVNGTPPLWVEFQLNGAPIGTFTNIGGALTANLTLTAAQVGLGGTYSIIVTNQFGTLNSATNGQDYSVTSESYPQFTWFAPQPITTADATLELFGGATNPAVVFEATGFGGDTGAGTPVTLGDGQVITFEQVAAAPFGFVTGSAPGQVATGNGQCFQGDFGTYTGTTGNTDFDNVLNGTDNGVMANVSSMTFSNLTPGGLYGLQIFAVDDRGGNGAPDLIEFQDPNDLTNISQSYLLGANNYSLGMFVANGTTQSVNMNLPGLTAGGDILDAAVIYSLPLGAMAWDTPAVSPSTTVFAGTLLTISEPLLTGIPPFRYQWQANGVNISGATNSVLTITAANASQSAPVVVNYGLVAANASGTNTSPAVSVTINPLLSLSVSVASGVATISWPTGVSSYVLQTTGNLSQPWTTVSGPYPIVGGRYQVTESATGTAFFRLESPQ